MRYSISALSLLISLFMISCRSSEKRPDDEVMVFCAASLTNVITELKDSFMLQNTASVKLNLASSGALARQIEQGNITDIFISASEEWALYADSLNLFSQRKPLYQNKLVLIAPKSGTLDTVYFNTPISPMFTGYLSMGDPAHVPAGMYSRKEGSSPI